MIFEELLLSLKNIPAEESRAALPAYFEAVFTLEHMPAVRASLEAYFGAALKPAGVPASIDAVKIAKAYGGIQTGQTLYAGSCAEGADRAFLWPWGNGLAVTVKVLREQ
ncbi:MAG: hypothetical protein GX606_06445 [Elusimicrobia bacterium]|nr:hypothetical protein [Elusimicrobiota bacterium]